MEIKFKSEERKRKEDSAKLNFFLKYINKRWTLPIVIDIVKGADKLLRRVPSQLSLLAIPSPSVPPRVLPEVSPSRRKKRMFPMFH